MRRSDETNIETASLEARDGAHQKGLRRPGSQGTPDPDTSPGVLLDRAADRSPGGWVERWGRWSWTPLPMVVVLAMALQLWGPSRTVESPALLLVLQGFFLGGGGLFVAWVAAWAVVKRPSLPVLMLGAGSLIMGTVGLIAAVGVPMGQVNAGITVHNTGMLAAGVFHLLAGLTMGRLLGHRLALGRERDPAGMGLTVVYTAAAVGVLVLSMAAFAGLTPEFVRTDRTTTGLRQLVLGAGVGLFALSAAVIGLASSNRGGAFGWWYATGAALMSGGLLTVAMVTQVGSPLGWVGRAAQYVGAAHMVMAVLAASRGAGAWEKGLHAALREAEREAEEQAARLRTMAEAAPQIAFVMEADGRTGYANSRWEEFFGSSFAEAAAKRWAGTMHPDDDWVLPKWEDCVERGAVFEAEYRLQRKDGTARWHLGRAVPVMEPGGKVAGWCGTLTDIHEIKEASERARAAAEREREANRRTREIVDSVSDGLMMIDRSWTVTFVNERGDALMRPVASGVRPGEPLTGHGLFELFPEVVGTAFERAYRRAMESREVQEVEAYYPSASRWLAVRVYPSREGGISLYYLDVSERKRADTDLAAAQERLEAAMAAGDVATWVWDIPSDRVTGDRNLRKFYAISDLDPAGVPVEDYVKAVHPDDRAGLAESIAEVVRSGSEFTAEYRVLSGDGVMRWVLARGRIERDAEGRAVRMPGVVLDVSARRRAEERARESDRLVAELTALVPGVLYLYDLESNRSVWVNRQVSEALGYTDQEVLAIGAELQPMLLHPDDREKLGRHFAALRSLPDGQHATVEYRFRHKDGTWRWFESQDVVYRRGSDGRATQLLGVATDVTERKSAEQALRESRARLELGVRVAGLGLAEVDYARGINRLSAEAAQMFGLGDGSEPVEVPRERVHATFHPDNREELKGLIAASLDPAGPGHFERDHRVVRPDGSVRWLRVRKQVEFEGEGAARRPARATMAALDVTAEKQAAEAVRRSELFLRAVLDSLPQHVVVLDGRGVVRAVNEPWERFAADNGGSVSGVSAGANYLEVCRRSVASGDASARDVLAGLEALFSGACRECVAEYPCPNGGGDVRWFMLHARRAPVGAGGGDGVIMSHVDITDRKRAEAALSESEVRHRRMFERNPQPMWVYDRQTLKFLAVNDAAVAKYGWTREQFLSMTVADIRPAADVPRSHRAVEDPEGLWSNPDVWTHLTRDGREIEVEINAHPMEFEGREAVLIMALDVTERRRAERALRESEERFRTMADGLPAVVWVHDETGAQRFVNKTFSDFFGVTAEGMTGEKWKELTHPVDGAEYVERFAECVRERKPFSAKVRARRADGEWRIMESYGRPRFGEGGEFLGIIGASFDVTERVRAEEAVRESEERLRLASEAAEVGIHDWDILANRAEWDDRVRQVWGVGADTVVDFETFSRGLHPDDLQATIDAVERATDPAGDGRFMAEYRVRNLTDGTVRRVAATGTVSFSGGKAVRLVGTTTDVTRQRDAEDALRRATGELERANAELTRANKAKDEFLAALSHELRTPLTPVLLLTGEMLRDESLPAQARADLATVRHNVELEVRLIDDLLDLTRITRGKLELRSQDAELHAIIEHAIDTCCDEVFTAKRLKLDRQLRAAEHSVRGDPARLGQVVWNLVKNAVKFTPEDGTITVRTWNPTPGRVAIEVRDTGVGIAPEVLPTIFDAFEQGGKMVTRQFGGLGLGLAIARAMVQMHGGTIRADSDGPGKGAVFTVELPTVAGPGPAAPAARAIAPASPARRLRILLVEDHDATRRIMQRLLGTLGCEVTAAGCVAEAVAAARVSLPDLVVSDVGLPDGTGHDVMTHVRELGDVPGIALSGYGTDADLARSKEAGFAEHLVKPVGFDRLKEAIARVAPH